MREIAVVCCCGWTNEATSSLYWLPTDVENQSRHQKMVASQRSCDYSSPYWLLVPRDHSCWCYCCCYLVQQQQRTVDETTLRCRSKARRAWAAAATYRARVQSDGKVH